MGFQVFFLEMEEDFIKGLKKGITFFTWWGGEESDVVFTTIFHFDTFSFFSFLNDSINRTKAAVPCQQIICDNDLMTDPSAVYEPMYPAPPKAKIRILCFCFL